MELSFIAQQLDEEERMRMAEGGMSSEEYRTFLQVTIFITLEDCFKPALFCEVTLCIMYLPFLHCNDRSRSK